MRKDELDGQVQRKQKVVVGIFAAAAGAIVTGLAVVIAPMLPEEVRPFAAPVGQEAGKAVEDGINSAAGGPELCPDSMCNAMAGPAYSMHFADGGVCRCVSR